MTFQEIRAAFEDAGLEPRSYSGRAMYGRKCLGVTTDSPVDAILDVILAVGENDPESVPDLVEALRGSRQDAMGRSAIVYWPGIEWPDGEADGDEDDEDDE